MNLEGRGIVQWTDALTEEGAIAKKEEEGALFAFLRSGMVITSTLLGTTRDG